ncbi:FAD-dependent monooxygenase [Streptomyces sp. NPDC020800]|uniref:FAD-dependent monooxygenase n=1 Tax=Streptomyces sp. NPDC020800 TaxID=3365092 RepID=UPI00378B4D72
MGRGQHRPGVPAGTWSLNAPTSACASGNLPQEHLEPRLRQAAEQNNPGNVRCEHEVVSLGSDAEGATAVVRSTEGLSEVRARYAIAADGGRTVADAGISMAGLPPLGRAVALHFAADLSGTPARRRAHHRMGDAERAQPPDDHSDRLGHHQRRPGLTKPRHIPGGTGR